MGQNAGSVFVGRWSAQPMGDYISGPNHTLPTGGMARVRGGLSVNDFVKLITVQEYAQQALRTLGPKAVLLAEAEGLTGHAEAIRTRLKGGPVLKYTGSGSSVKGRDLNAYGSMSSRMTGARTIRRLRDPAPRARVQAMKEYHPPLGSRDALRLDFNENTLACSPKVREALGSNLGRCAYALSRARAGRGHRCRASRPCAPSRLLSLTASTRRFTCSSKHFSKLATSCCFPCPPIPCTRSMPRPPTRSVVAVQAADDLQFPFERLLAAITPRTKIIAIANPNSPSGSVATRAQLLELARLAPQAVLLVDEAYFHFCGETVIDLIGSVPNLIVARTFSKAYGLAGLRLGLLAGPAESMRWIRRVLSPYSVNSLALACLPPALEDTAYLDWYVGEVLAARLEFEAALDEAKVRRWPSRANFILVDIGPRHAEFVRLMRDAGVLVRDRSSDPGCDGCVRITIGTRKQMDNATEALITTMAALRAGGK